MGAYDRTALSGESFTALIPGLRFTGEARAGWESVRTLHEPPAMPSRVRSHAHIRSSQNGRDT